jgi:hypothetical protein
MNTKKTIVALAIAMAVAFVASVGMASAATLYAGQDIDVGTVTVSAGGTTIKYATTGDWVLNATHLHVGSSLADIPQTKKFNPIPGHFEYSAEHVPPVTTYTYTIPAQLGTLYIAAQAEVAFLDDEGVWQEETAWAGTSVGHEPFLGKNWATYFVVSPVEKYASKEYVKAGDEVLYTVVVSNHDDSPLKMMEVKETMQMMTYVEKSCSLLDIAAVKETVMKNVGRESIRTWTAMDAAGVKIPVLEIAPGASTMITLKATIDEDAVKGQILRNVIEVIVRTSGGVGFTHTAEAVVTVVEA